MFVVTKELSSIIYWSAFLAGFRSHEHDGIVRAVDYQWYSGPSIIPLAAVQPVDHPRWNPQHYLPIRPSLHQGTIRFNVETVRLLDDNRKGIEIVL